MAKDEGPTTVGSIVGKLKLDISDWEAKIEVAKAKARDLGASDPTVTVHANTAEASAALDKVKVKTKDLADAEAKLVIAQQAAALASQRADLAQQKLDQVRTNSKSTDIQLAAAEIALEAATMRETAATEKAIVMTRELNAAREEEGKESIKENDSKKTNINRTMVIIALIATLIPMLGPLSGYAIGVAGALSVMGVAGVVAILGIRNAMASGTAEGQVYSAGLQSLKADFNQLEHTATTAMLVDFNQAVGAINRNMPFLNNTIGLFTHQLGSAGVLTLQGAINFLKVLNPLFLQSGVYVMQLANGFKQWTQNGGLQAFGNYAQRMLPVVAQDLGQLISGILHLVTALSPLGTVILGSLGLLGTVLNAIPTPILLGLVTVVGLVLLGFKLWSIIPGIIEKVKAGVVSLGAVSEVAGGPVGLLLLAVSAIAVVMTAATAATEDQTKATQSYTAAVEEDNGVIGKNVELQAAKNLQDAKAFDSATKLGIKTEELVKAALGQNDAMLRVNQKLDEQSKKYAQLNTTDSPTFIANTRGLSASQRALKDDVTKTQQALSTQQGAVKAAIAAYNQLAKSVGDTSISTRAELQAQQDLADSYGASLGAYLSAQAANKQTQTQLAATTLQMRLQNDAAGLLTNALVILNGGSLSLAQAQTGQAAATNSLTDSLKQNGLVIEGNSKAAVANQQAVQQKVLADQAAAEAVGKATKSSVAATKAYMDGKAALEAQLKTAGQLTPAMQSYIDKLYNIANLKLPPTKLDVDDAAALAKLAAWNTAVSKSVRTATFSIDGSIHYTNGIVTRAGGGWIPGASSPTGDKVNVAASPNEFIVNAASASRYKGLVEAVNDGSAQEVAAAAAPYASGSGAPVSVVVVNKTGVSLDDLIELHVKQNNQSQRVNISTGTQRENR